MKARQRKKNARPMLTTIYECCQNYGGSEEGGWWWTSYEPVMTCRTKQFHRQLLKIQDIYDYLDTGKDVNGRDPECSIGDVFYISRQETRPGQFACKTSGGYS